MTRAAQPHLPLVYSPDYVTPLPSAHRFPMPKFGRIVETLLRDGIAGLEQFHVPGLADRAWLELVHTPAYIDSYLTGSIDARAMRRIGFPWSPALVQRTCTAVGGTVLTARLALEHGLACNTAGGTHHAHADFGSGYCIFNDLAVAARVMQQEGRVARVLIVDLDVHQGDGTAAIFANDPSVFTFSIHCGKNFPFRKQTSDLDIDLPPGTGDERYLAQLNAALGKLLDAVKPNLVLYDGGVDPHVDDRLGKFALTDQGLMARDRHVMGTCLGRGIPVATVVGGGYGADIGQLARRHCLLVQEADKLYHTLR